MATATATDEFYTTTTEAFNAMWPRLVELSRRDTAGPVHEFALAAASRIAGIVSGTGWGASAEAVQEAAGAASQRTRKSVDAYLRVYESTSQAIQTADR